MKNIRKKLARILAVALTVPMLVGTLSPAAFAVDRESAALGSSGEFVTPISAHGEVAVKDTLHATTFDALATYLKKTELYTTPKYEEYPALDVGVSVYYDDTDADGNGIADSVERGRKKDFHIFGGTTPKRDVIVYVVNYAGERIGQEEDVSILQSYIEDGYVVLVADYNKNPLAGTPNLEHSLALLGDRYGGSGNSGSTVCGTLTNGKYFYYLPAGYRLARNVWYWNSYNYSSLGTRQSVINAWNKCLDSVEPKGSNNGQTYQYTDDFTLTFKDANGETVTISHTAGEAIDSVTYLEECVRKDGSNLRYDCYLDIIYPSQPKKATPVYSMAATQPDRHDNTCEVERCTFVGMTFSGYTTAIFDYVYTPMVHNDAYGYIDSYGTHGQNILKSASAAMRCIRYYAKDYGFDPTLIGVGGISKGSPAAAALSVIDNEQCFEPATHSQDKAVRTQYGVASAYEGDLVLSDTERLTIQQPFLYYDVPYGPVYNADGSVNKDVYGNVITYDYYGADGVQYIRAAAEGDLRASTHVSTDLYESDDGFRTTTGISIRDDYRSAIDARSASDDFIFADGYTSASGSATLTIPRIYGTDDNTRYSACVNEFDTYYYFVDSDANCVYASAGDGVNRFTRDNIPNLGSYPKVPMLICCGSFDPYGCFDWWYAIRASFEEGAPQPAVNPYFPIPMMDQGHTYPTGYDYDHGFWRHDAFLEFFHHYLKPDEYDFPEIIWSKPVAGTSVASVKSSVELKFYDKVDVDSIIAGAIVTDSEGNVVAGNWTADECDTHFTFTPAGSLKASENYTLTVSSAVVKNPNGKFLREDYVRSFATTGMNNVAFPVADTYVYKNLSTTAMHTKSIYNYILKVDGNQFSYVTFDKADLADKVALRFEAVYQSVKSGTSFDVCTIDNYKVDATTLTYNNRPTSMNFAGTVTTDENGYGYLSLANLGLGKSGNVTFVLCSKDGSSLMFESEASAERGSGVVAVGQADMVMPVADAYVSSAAPTGNYGTSPVLSVNGSGSDIRISYFTYATEQLADRATAKLSLPILTLSGNGFKVYAFDGYRVDEGTLTWENRPSLDGAVFVGTTTASADGVLTVDLSGADFEGEYVTFAVCAEEDVTVYTQNFSGSVVHSLSETLSYSATGTYRTGAEPRAHGKTTDPADSSNSCFYLQTGASRIARAKFYNVWSDTADLTAADIGKHYRISFDVKVSEDGVADQDFGYGLMNVYGQSYLTKVTATLTTEWQHMEYDVVVTAAMINANPYIFSVDHGGAEGSKIYIDNLVSEIPGASMTVSSREGDADSCAVVMVAGVSDTLTLKPASETMVSVSEPSRVFGNVDAITVDGEHIGILTYRVADLKNAAMVLKLPLSVPENVTIRVSILDDAADVATFNYNTYRELESHLVGTLTSDGTIVVTGAMGHILGDYATFALELVPEYEYRQDYTDIQSFSQPTATAPTVENGVVTAWNDVLIYADESDGVAKWRSGYNGSNLTIRNEDGNNFLRNDITKGTGARRFKLFNVFRNDRNFTQDDLGKTYRISFDIRLSVAGRTVSYGVMNPFTFQVGNTSYSGTQYRAGQSFSDYTAGEWKHITCDIPVTQAMIDGQYGMFAFDCTQSSSETATLDIDNLCSYVIAGVTFGTRTGSTSYARLLHTHEYTETPTAASQVPGSADTYYENCSCGLLNTEKTFTHTHGTPVNVNLAKYRATEATCAAPALYWQSCSDCGMALDTTFEGEYAAHTPKSEAEADGTVICSVCGTILTAPTSARWSVDGTTWTFASLPDALASLSGKEGIVEVMQDTVITEALVVSADSRIVIRTYSGYPENRVITRGSAFKSGMFTLGAGSELTFADITVDGAKMMLSAVKGGIINIPAGSVVTLEKGAKMLNSYAGTSGAYGGAFYLTGGSELNMKDGSEIRGCYARAGGAICLDEGNSSSGAIFNMTGGLITGCASGRSKLGSGDEWGSGGAVTVRAYAVMNMSGGVITGNFGGRANGSQSFVNDGAINLFSSTNVYTCRLNLSGNAVIRGNTAYQASSAVRTLETPTVDSDISIAVPCGNAASVIFIDAGFTGSVGISLPNATFGTVSGTDSPTEFGKVVNNTLPKVAVVNGTALVWTDAAAEIPSVATIDGISYPISKRYSALADAIAEAKADVTVRILNDTTVSASVTLPAVGFTIDGEGHTVTRGSAFADAMFRLESAGTHLTIQNVTFDGNKLTANTNETGGVFYVGDGTSLTMNAGTVIRNSYLKNSGNNRGGAVYVAPGGLFTMNGGIIRNCEARSGGAVYLLAGSAAKYASFVMNDGLIAECRSTSQQAMGAAVFMGGYADMKMSGGMITGNVSIRQDYGGFTVKTTNSTAHIPKDQAADGAIAFRDSTGHITLSGNAVIRGNTALNMHDPNGPRIDSDIAFFSKQPSCIVILPDFVGTVGIRYPNSTYTYTGTLKDGATVPTSLIASVIAPITDITATPVADGTVAVATAQGFKDGQILGTVVDNSSANKVAKVKNNQLVWTTAEAETDMDGIITRYVSLADAIAANRGTPILLRDASLTLAAVDGDTVKIAENGYTLTLTYVPDALIPVRDSSADYNVTYGYGSETFTGPVLRVTTFRAAEGVVNAANITVGTDLTLKLYAIIGGGKSNVQLRVTMNPGAENERVTLIDGTLYDAASNTYVFSFTGITPQCMGDKLNAQLVCDGVDFGLALTGYSISDYCKNLMELSQSNSFMLTLISDLVAYGAAAQSYTGYKTDSLVTDAFTDVAGYAPSDGTITDSTPMTLTEAIRETVAITTAGLEYSNVNRLYFKFKTDDLSKTTITIGTKTVTPILVSGTTDTYVVYTDALTARNFDDVYEVVLSYTDENGTATQTLTYSVNNYVSRMQNSTNEAMRTLAKATYFYGVSAENFR